MGSDVVIGDNGAPPIVVEPQAEPEPLTEDQIAERETSLRAYLEERGWKPLKAG